MPVGKDVTLAGSVVYQAEIAVGAATVRLTTVDMPCKRVRVSAPTANHTVGEVNTGNIIVGSKTTTALNISGGCTLENDNYAGLDYPCANADEVYLTGFNAGDVAEVEVFR